jgi:hypothetical protein
MLKKLTIIVPISLALIAGCNSGESASSTGQNESIAFDGPLNPYVLAISLDKKALSNQQMLVNKKISMDHTLQSSSTAWSYTALGSMVLSRLIPGAGIAFGPLTITAKILGGLDQQSELAADFEKVEYSLISLQTEINSLQVEISENNILYNAFVSQQSTSNYCSALQNWDSSLANIFESQSNYLSTSTTCGSTYNNVSTGVVNQFFGYMNSALATVSIESAASDQLLMNNISKLSSNYSENFSSYVDNISASTVSPAAATTQLNNKVDYGVYNSFITDLQATPSTSSCTTTSNANATTSLLACGYEYFLENLLPTPGIQSNNVTDNINAYNNQLVNMYQQNAVTLSGYAFTIEAYINLLNYLNYTNYLNCKSNQGSNCEYIQIPPLENIPAVNFSVGGQGSALLSQISPDIVSTTELADQYYLAAQQNLTSIYAARINALYRNVLRFVISDGLLSTQSYTLPPLPSVTINGGGPTINFPQQQTVSIPAATLKSSTTSGQIPGGAFGSSGVFYQYNGIINLSCIESAHIQTLSMTGNGAINISSCTEVFPNSYSSYYDGVSMQAYVPNSSAAGGASLTANTLNMSQQCIPITNLNSLSNQAPNMFNNILQCGFYGGSDYVNSNVFPGNETFPSQLNSYMYLGGLAWDPFITVTSKPGTQYGIWSLSTTTWFLASSISNGSGGAYSCNTGNGNFWMGTNNNPAVAPCLIPTYDSGFGNKVRGASYHEVLLQTTLGNGFVAPFYIVTVAAEQGSNTKAPVAGSISCPPTTPFGSTCQAPVSSGTTTTAGSGLSINYTTPDGNVYDISLDSGQNAIYISVS